MTNRCNNNLTNEPWSASDRVSKFSGVNFVQRYGTIAQLQEYMQANLDFGSSSSFTEYTTQYDSPITGSTVQLTDSNVNTHLILTPLATIAALTLKLPAVGNLIDKQDILINCTQDVTVLTIDGNGVGAVTGAPTDFKAGGFFRLKYDLTLNVWFRVG